MAVLLSPELRILLAAPTAIIPAVALEMGNPEWDMASARILIVRLSSFRDVDRSSPHLILFSECRLALPDAFLDFSFFPDRQDRAILDDRGFPYFYGIASGREIGDFDLIMVSNAFGLELVNLPYLFSTSGLAAAASERAATIPASPIVVLGGSNAAASGALLLPGPEDETESDSFVDGIFFGEGEGAIGELAKALVDRGRKREDRLAKAARIEGFWPARSGKKAERRVVRHLAPPLVSHPVLNSGEAGTARLQISAGCPGFCSFCFEGWDRRPYREVPLGLLVEAARKLRAGSGADTLEVYSFNFNTHADLFPILFELNRIFLRVNLMSQRLDILARTPGMLRAELAADKRSFTLGIEGISTRMRAYYRKGLSGSDIELLFERLFAPALRELKLFFIISGREEEDDLAEFAAFAKELRTRRASASPGLRILVSAGYLVRLPFTPLQFAPLALDETALRKISVPMQVACETNGIEFRLASHFDEYCADQVIALGGRALAPWLARTPRANISYDGSLSRNAWNSLKEFASDAGLLGGAEGEASLFTAEKGRDWSPPLDFLQDDREREVLWRNYVDARRKRDRVSCLGSECGGCGACADEEERLALTGHRNPSMPEGDFLGKLARLQAAKAAFKSIQVEVDLPPSLHGATAQYRSSWLLRKLEAASPGASAAVFEARETLFSSGPLSFMLPAFTGRCAFSLSGPDPRRLRAVAESAGLPIVEVQLEPARVELEIEIPSHFSGGATSALRAWLAEERVDVLEERVEGGRRLKAAGRDAKKGVLIEALLRESEDGAFRSRMILGRKARLGDWLSRLGQRAAQAVMLRVVDYGD